MVVQFVIVVAVADVDDRDDLGGGDDGGLLSEMSKMMIKNYIKIDSHSQDDCTSYCLP